jgi:hypothetical protein
MDDLLTSLALVSLVPALAQVYLYWRVWNGNRDLIDPVVLMTGLVPLLGLVPLMVAYENQKNDAALAPPRQVLTDPGDDINAYITTQHLDDLGLDDLDTMENH